MVFKTWGTNELLASEDLNNNFSATGKILAVYTGTGFDSTQGTSGTNTVSYENALIPAASLTNSNYIRIKVTFTAQAASNSTGPSNASASLKIEEKYNGGAYSTVFDNSVISQGWFGGTWGGTTNKGGTVEFLYTLNANDIASGVYLKLTSSSYSGGNGCTGSFTNIQTVIETAN